jgi:hypothetical protein
MPTLAPKAVGSLGIVCGKPVMVRKGEPDQAPQDDSGSKRVVGYFLNHEKPKGEAKPKPRKRRPANRKAATKAKRRG